MRRSSLTIAVLLIGAVSVAGEAAAGTCARGRRMKLEWTAANGEGLLVFGAGECDLPSACLAARLPPRELATQLPLTIAVRAGGAPLISATLGDCGSRACRSENTGGCPGGFDMYKDREGMAKVSYSRRGEASVMARIRAPMTAAPRGSGPVTVQVSDGAGYSAETTFEKCKVDAKPSTVTMECR